MQIRRSIRVGPEGCAPETNDAASAGYARQSVTSQPRLQPFSSWRSLKVLLVWLCAVAGSIKRAASSGSTRDRTSLGDVEVVVVRDHNDSAQWLTELRLPVVVFRGRAAPEPAWALPADSSMLREAQRVQNHACSDEHGRYLQYIITHYNHLHEVTVFLHGHPAAWHEPPGERKADRVRALAHRTLNSTRGVEFLLPKDCKKWQLDVNMINSTIWREYFEEALGEKPPVYGETDPYLTPCCSQFAVRKHAVLQHPRSFYVKLLTLACASTGSHDSIALSFERIYGLMFASYRPVTGSHCPGVIFKQVLHNRPVAGRPWPRNFFRP